MSCKVKACYRLYYTNDDAWWKPWWILCIHVSYVYYDMNKRINEMILTDFKPLGPHAFMYVVHHDTSPLC